MSNASACGGRDDGSDALSQYTKTRDRTQQTIISVVLGLAAFLSFCVLRPRWSGLYAARKKQKNAASILPQLPPTFFGWIPVVWKITDDEVLASAGLDAFVFLRFFKMAVKYLAFVFFFVITVIFPVQKNFNETGDEDDDDQDELKRSLIEFLQKNKSNSTTEPWMEFPADYLWIYVVFAYVFSGALIWLIITETNYIVRIRQKYLSTESSVTDRTIRLSGIPRHLRSEAKIKETIEKLQIGKVERMTLCRNWAELDGLMDERMVALRKLEEAWTVHLGYRQNLRKLEPFRAPTVHEDDGDETEDENTNLLGGDSNGSTALAPSRIRPTTRLWYSVLNLQSHKVDAIDYYEEKLRTLDDKIKAAREQEFEPTALAFVTLDSIAACQMAVQAILDPVPMQLRAKPAPSPADVVWKNTYLPRRNRMVKAWSITAFVVLLTLVWWIIFFPVAALLNISTIGKVLPQLQEFLCSHEMTRSLVTTTLPTLILSLMLVLVPYLYDWLSNLQGMISQGDVEMSVISKNFFFTFFNLFISFTIFGTASNAFTDFNSIKDKFDEVRAGGIMYILAKGLGDLSTFYTNLIVLQAVGLSPFRLLEFGAVSLYPIGLMGSKTPRDYAELVQPPVFSYGFYLPQILFVFLICIVYSVLPGSHWMIPFGLIYFLVGGFIYKYQLLYAMDHRHLSTGRAWSMICNRIVVGLFFFQIAMAGELGFKLAAKSGADALRTVLFVPLVVGTCWFGYVYRRTYDPPMRFIALRSLHDAHASDGASVDSREAGIPPQHHQRLSEDEVSADMTYVNPSLVIPLEEAWIAMRSQDEQRANGEVAVDETSTGAASDGVGV